MTLYNISKAILIVFSAVYVSNVVYTFYNKRRKKEIHEINEVIMFSSGEPNLKQSKHSRKQVTQSMDRLLYFLNSPRTNIDICMYIITNTDILNAIIKLHIRGIKIRVIMDADMAYSSGSVIRRFDKYKIPVRWMKSTYLMHHKFCLIDTSAQSDVRSTPLVMMGSLNWTNQALNGNWEDVIVTTQIDLVTQYKTEFERMWLQFKPIVDLK